MAYANVKEAEKVLQVALGLDKHLRKDDHYLGMMVREQQDHSYGRRFKPTGKFYVTLNPVNPGRHVRDKMFKTKISLDNEFDIAEIKAHIEAMVQAQDARKKADAKAANIKTVNAPIVERVKAAYNGKRFISSYRSSNGSNSIVPSESQEGIVRIMWGFDLTEEKAMKLMEFINELEGE